MKKQCGNSIELRREKKVKQADIQEAEKLLGHALPSDLAAFYQTYSNGIELEYDDPSREDESDEGEIFLRINSLQDVVRHTLDERAYA